MAALRFLPVIIAMVVFSGCVLRDTTSPPESYEDVIIGHWSNAESYWEFWEDGKGRFEIYAKTSDVNLEEYFHWEVIGGKLTIESDDEHDKWYVDEYKIGIAKRKSTYFMKLDSMRSNKSFSLYKLKPKSE